jgi:hypothetical protein
MRTSHRCRSRDAELHSTLYMTYHVKNYYRNKVVEVVVSHIPDVSKNNCGNYDGLHINRLYSLI